MTFLVEHLLPEPRALQGALVERSLFDQAILPLLGTGEKVALFVLDALRFEMALELHEEL